MNTERILLVDDERAIRLAVRTAPDLEGMQVTEASDGSEAFGASEKQQLSSGDSGCDDGACGRL